MSCPFACPVAWNNDRGNPCVHGRSRTGVPANDCPLVSPRALACPPGGVPGQLPVICDSPWQGRGVASCPLACPLARAAGFATDPHQHLACCSALPAKERQKRRQQNPELGGGL
jgi:hypothetical protein